jgi:Flp pilus assembly protein TadG
MRLRHKSRQAASLVEYAIIAPLMLLMILGLVIGALGVFRYQEIAALTRESSRWASVHGAQYANDTGNPAATPKDVFDNVIAARGVGLNQSKLGYSVTWNTNNGLYHSATVNGIPVTVANTVKVTITYNWISERYFGGITLTSTSESVMAY